MGIISELDVAMNKVTAKNFVLDISVDLWPVLLPLAQKIRISTFFKYFLVFATTKHLPTLFQN